MGHNAEQLGWNLASSGLRQHMLRLGRETGAFVRSRVLFGARELVSGCPIGGL